jgi:hypothetical protein
MWDLWCARRQWGNVFFEYFGFSLPVIITLYGNWVRLRQEIKKKKTKTKLQGFSLQVNYTDRATATCQRSYCQLLWIEGVAWSVQQIHTAVNVGFLDPEPLFFHSSSSSVIPTRLSGPSSRPTISQKIS